MHPTSRAGPPRGRVRRARNDQRLRLRTRVPPLEMISGTNTRAPPAFVMVSCSNRAMASPSVISPRKERRQPAGALLDLFREPDFM